ncbi:MAG: aldo/keto reductase [Erysipelotrichaceae bacterium]
MLLDSYTMHNGVTIPKVGFGTFKIEDGEVTKQSVLWALQQGIRHIDTAAIYQNEESVGEAIKTSGIAREEIFLTTKLWNDKHAYDDAIEAFETSCKKLGVDYIDLYLVHWPKELNTEAWRALEDLYLAKKIRAIGVSNFKEHHLDEILAMCRIKPMMNQVEFHPQFQQESLRSYCDAQDILITGWGPLMQGKIFEKEVMQTLAEKYNKTISQITLRWHLQKGVVLIPKSIKEHRIAENIDIFDFVLAEEDMNLIDTLNTATRIGPDPDTITF